MPVSEAITLERAVIDRESALNRERVLRSAVEETLQTIGEIGDESPYGALALIEEFCQAALDETEAGER